MKSRSKRWARWAWVLLMFSLGLEFSLRKLTRVGLSAFVAALLEIVLMIWLGYEVGRAFGWTTMDSVFLGAMLSISSTTIIVKALAEVGKSREAFAEIIFGILVIEDILAIILLALLSGFARTGSLHAGQVGIEVVKLAVFFAMVLVAGFILVPRLFEYIAKFKSDEMLLIAALGLCFGIALVASMLNYSVALGAFSHRRRDCGVATNTQNRSVDRARARHVQRHFLRHHRHAD